MVPAGIAWYKSEDDYKKLLKIFEDAANLPDTYQEWLNGAKQGIKEMAAKGYTLEPVNIDPETFPDWCASRGLNINAEARIAFVNFTVFKNHSAKK